MNPVKLVKCKACTQEIRWDHFLCKQCLEDLINIRIKQLKPSMFESGDHLIVFPNYMAKTMHDDLLKEISDAMKCFYYELWNPGIIICTRIFEFVLRTHIDQDLKVEDELRNLGQCIEILKDRNYDAKFIKRLDELRELRNDAMHYMKRYKSSKAMDIFSKVMGITAWIYNMKLQDSDKNNKVLNQQIVSSSLQELDLKCSECGKKFTQQNLLLQHTKMAHQPKPQVLSLQKKCDTCGKQFKTQKSLLQHAKMAHQPKPQEHSLLNKCDTCGKQFKTQNALDQHLKSPRHNLKKTRSIG